MSSNTPHLNDLRHCLVVGIIIIALRNDVYNLAAALAWFLLADLAAYVLIGGSPFSILGDLCTYFLWPYRGPYV